MKNSYLILFALIVVIFSNCSGGADTPVSLQIPFSGAMTNDSIIIVTNGAPVGGNSPLNLAFKSQQIETECRAFVAAGSLDGNEVGECEVCRNVEAVESTPYLEDGRRDHFNMEVRCMVDGDVVAAVVEVFDFPHLDETIDVPSLVPEGEVGELRSGICSGVIKMGDGIFLDSPGKELMTGKYVAVSKLEAGIKTFFHHIEWVWILDR